LLGNFPYFISSKS